MKKLPSFTILAALACNGQTVPLSHVTVLDPYGGQGGEWNDGTNQWIVEQTQVGCIVTGATNASPIVISCGSPHTMSNGRYVMVFAVQGNTAANTYAYAKVTGYSTTTFALFSDSGLTTPVSGSGTYVSGTGVVYAYKNPATCGTTSAPCPLYSDFLFQVGGATAYRSRFDICASMRATAGADCSCGDGAPSPLGNMNFLLQESGACATRNVAPKAGNGYDVYAATGPLTSSYNMTSSNSTMIAAGSLLGKGFLNPTYSTVPTNSTPGSQVEEMVVAALAGNAFVHTQYEHFTISFASAAPSLMATPFPAGELDAAQTNATSFVTSNFGSGTAAYCTSYVKSNGLVPLSAGGWRVYFQADFGDSWSGVPVASALGPCAPYTPPGVGGYTLGQTMLYQGDEVSGTISNVKRLWPPNNSGWPWTTPLGQNPSIYTEWNVANVKLSNGHAGLLCITTTDTPAWLLDVFYASPSYQPNFSAEMAVLDLVTGSMTMLTNGFTQGTPLNVMFFPNEAFGGWGRLNYDPATNCAYPYYNSSTGQFNVVRFCFTYPGSPITFKGSAYSGAVLRNGATMK